MIVSNSILIVMSLLGAFDTLYYHEYKLRLGALTSSRRELKLHGMRDLIYAVVFASIGWIEWRGVLAPIFLILLLTEVGITLTDFIEESRSREVPPVERSMHAIMGIVFGFFLAHLIPELYKWWTLPTEFAFTNYGIISWILSLMALGVFASGIRDLMTSNLGRAWPRIWTR